MGCVGSKGDVNDKHPNMFRVHHERSSDSDPRTEQDSSLLWSGQLEVTATNLTLYRKRKPPTEWPLQCLRRYGYENNTFIFEAGRRCNTGEGIYSFRCQRADTLFNLLQKYILESTQHNNNNNTMTVTSLDDVQGQQGPPQRMDTDVAELRRALMAQQQLQHQMTTGSNYIILHGTNGPGGASGGATSPVRVATVNSCGGSPRNTSAVNSNANNNNYLEPLDGGTISPTAATNPLSNNIYTNVPPPPPGGGGASDAVDGAVGANVPLSQSSPAQGSSKVQSGEWRRGKLHLGLLY